MKKIGIRCEAKQRLPAQGAITAAIKVTNLLESRFVATLKLTYEECIYV
jgi:hypothetical protein